MLTSHVSRFPASSPTTTRFAVAISILLLGCHAAPTREPTSGKPAVLVPAESDQVVASDAGQSDQVQPTTTFRTVADAQATINALGSQPSAQQLATVLIELDTWLVAPDQQQSFRQLQLAQLTRLRSSVTNEVQAHHTNALRASTSNIGAAELDAAGQVLALYPMSDDRAVITEAKRLSSRQIEVTARLEALRRQRYNRWAIDQIERAINYFDKNKPFFSGENAELINPLVTRLGPIDPLLLEPVVMELYRYILGEINLKLSTESELAFAKKLTATSITRKSLGDM